MSVIVRPQTTRVLVTARGPQGPVGPPAGLTIGDVSTGAPGEPGSGTITGPAGSQQLSLVLPQPALVSESDIFALAAVCTIGVSDADLSWMSPTEDAGDGLRRAQHSLTDMLRWQTTLLPVSGSLAISRSGDTYTLWRSAPGGLWWRVTLFRFIDPVDGDIWALNASALVRVGSDVDQADLAWSFTPSEAWITSSHVNALGGTYARATNIAGTATWTTPGDTIAVGLRAFYATNGGYGLVTIDGGDVVADRLPTAQDEVDAGRLAASALTTGGGTLDPDARLYDFHLDASPNGTAFAYQLLADGLAPGVHEVSIGWTGYARSGSGGLRVTIDGGWHQTTTSQPSAAAAWLPVHTFMTTASSVYEYAFSVKPRGTGTYGFIGNSHGYDAQTSLTVTVDGTPITVTDGATVTATDHITLTRESTLTHPDATGDVAAVTAVYRLGSRAGLDLATTVEWLQDMDASNSYTAMLPTLGSATSTGRIAGSASVALTADDGSEHDGHGAGLILIDAAGTAATAMIITDLAQAVDRWVATTTRHTWIQDRSGGDFNKGYLSRVQTPGTPIDAGDVWRATWRIVAGTIPPGVLT